MRGCKDTITGKLYLSAIDSRVDIKSLRFSSESTFSSLCALTIKYFLGSRFNYSGYTRSHNILNKVGNHILTFFFNLFYNTTFTDIYSCYLCFKRELLDPSHLKTDGFDQHAEILSKTVKKGDRFYEVPISYNGRSHAEGKKIKFYHFFSVILRIFIERF